MTGFGEGPFGLGPFGGIDDPTATYGEIVLSEADIAPIDHEPTCNATDLQNGRVRLQGSSVSRRAWTIDALADDHAEIEALAALTGQHLTLNINGVEYPGVMIRGEIAEAPLAPSWWGYRVDLVEDPV
ncbi:MAG: hypothetical protein GXY82_00820 [Methanospirillum sp.]|nr:hypothetical protein [Methanospirillum sp.]